ncbi:undecaprenyl/decaprenyl-phosphate alpha-N-acetylglucosaminyl 1-phosphate transferase [Candidatus Falkowbacteria bacterium]|jgi:UDP-GlcNAc:undecaprenyl-phosphate/decaprenyl-phosphate GlcNAc-1-phosphate transferase|nr:undecaprenyl/decaprenyl-phosphate alpha-N-acetylglucosaminyl 1-phosphate transferase [Candidatus Falkowbacteria bacterium]MBT4433152.1 undecaprenyl/decaprenyl-phosphate alpha-N-acetylglucosaminyl 1-phosphate transferase [Candidatus Falkowbacteria bacterium]
MQYLLVGGGAFLLSIVFTVFIKRIAWQYKIVDRPTFWRKIHSRPTPLLGGVAIFFSFLIVSLYSVFFGDHIIGKYIDLKMMIGIWIASGIIILGGVLDDKKNLDPIKQIIWPIIAIGAVIYSGINIGYITNPFGGTVDFENLKWLSILITFLWLLGMSYTTKILDGLDGLTTGITLIGAITIFILSLFIGPAILPEVGMLAIIFVGALLGFLIFNWHRASIFLGEGGSLYCGFMIGVLAIITDGKIAVTLLVMGIPIIDLLFVIIKRLSKRQSPFSYSDKKHLHFQLLDIGLTHRQAVLFLYFLTILFGSFGLFFKSFGRFLSFLILCVFMLIIAGGIYFIYRKKENKRLV